MTNKIRMLDAPPTWEGVIPILILATKHGNKDGQRNAEIELKRMARIADLANRALPVITDTITFLEDEQDDAEKLIHALDGHDVESCILCSLRELVHLARKEETL